MSDFTPPSPRQMELAKAALGLMLACDPEDRILYFALVLQESYEEGRQAGMAEAAAVQRKIQTHLYCAPLGAQEFKQ